MVPPGMVPQTPVTVPPVTALAPGTSVRQGRTGAVTVAGMVVPVTALMLLGLMMFQPVPHRRPRHPPGAVAGTGLLFLIPLPLPLFPLPFPLFLFPPSGTGSPC
jgi:hypothetical protein